MQTETIESEHFTIDELLDREISEKVLTETNTAIDALPSEIRETLGEEERRHLAHLQEKDPITFDHSLGVAVEAQNQLEEFEEDFKREGLSRESFLRASALHDIGKLALPDVVLKGKKGFGDFERMFFANINSAPSFIEEKLGSLGKLESDQSISDIDIKTIESWNLNYRDFVSLSQTFQKEPEALVQCQAYGFDVDTMSFMDALRIHEERTKDIIRRMDIPDKDVVIEIAGSHHNYSKMEGEDFSQAKEVLRMTELAGELLHLNDVYHAITQARPYHKKRTEVEALYFILEEIHKGEFREDVGRRWMRRMLKTHQKSAHEYSQMEEKMRNEIEEFTA